MMLGFAVTSAEFAAIKEQAQANGVPTSVCVRNILADETIGANDNKILVAGVAKMGRKNRKHITTFLDPAAVARIRDAAKANGLSVTAYIRGRVFRRLGSNVEAQKPNAATMTGGKARQSPPSPEEFAALVRSIPAPTPKKPSAPRRNKPSATLYISRRARRAIKQIAISQDRKMHDLLKEGVELMLIRYGLPKLAELQD
jgi:hypothetical protein